MHVYLSDFNDLASALNHKAALGAMLSICQDIANESGGALDVTPNLWQLTLPGGDPVTVDIEASGKWELPEDHTGLDMARALTVDWLASLAVSLGGTLRYHDTEWELVLPDPPEAEAEEK